MLHRGEIVEAVVRENGIYLTKLAKKLGYSTRHLYNLFEKHNLSYDIIIEIGKIIGYDFRKNFVDIHILNSVEKPLAEQEKYSIEDYLRLKDKYIELLEKYNELLLKSNE